MYPLLLMMFQDAQVDMDTTIAMVMVTAKRRTRKVGGAKFSNHKNE
jgi:hypothetical protein